MRKPLIAANWKMHGRKAQTRELLSTLSQCLNQALLAQVDVVICPPLLYLQQSKSDLPKGAGLGAQNVAAQLDDGAHTGEVSAAMLADVGVTHVIVGHSERRHDQGETDALIAQKVAAALSSGLVPILCVGETLSEREQGVHDAVIAKQVGAVVAQLTVEQMQSMIIAYEPVWAIGTGLTAEPAQAQAIHYLVRGLIGRHFGADVAEKCRILYGGSVKPESASSLFSQKDIDGGLVGGASLNANDFTAICRAAAEAKVNG